MNKILFLDDFLVTRQRNVRRKFHSPRWLDDHIYRDEETAFGLSAVSVVPAPGGGYLLFYSAAIRGNAKMLCLARSHDGLDWKRVQFDPPRVPGFPRVVYPTDGESRGEGMNVYFDPEDPDVTRRYKLVEAYKGPRPACCRLAYSADAIDWRVDPDHPCLDRGSDAVNTLSRNPRSGRYQIVLRRAVGDRRIFLVESSDLKTWTPARTILHPDPSLPPMTTYYGMPHFRYEDIYLGFLYLYQTVEHDDRHDKLVGTIETELAYSYDGLSWNRTFRPFLPMREPGQYGGRSLYGMALLPRERDMLVYAVGSLREHHVVQRAKGEPARDALLVGTLRRDGFASFTSVAGPGEITTDCLYPRSPGLALNVCAPFGGVHVQVCDILCRPLPGYRFEDCEEIRGDHVAIQPRWREHVNLADAMQQVSTAAAYPGWLRLQVRIEQADLFSIIGDFGLTLRSGPPGADHL